MGQPAIKPVKLIQRVGGVSDKSQTLQLNVIALFYEWINRRSSMVMVCKKNNKIHIDVDLTKLNQNVKQEWHFLLAVE